MFVIRLLLLFAALVLTVNAVAQSNPKSDDPHDKPRKVKREPARAFTDFMKEVEPIITPAELAAWNKLKTDQEREQFIHIFWGDRDPSPDTEENEYREAYFERMAYVNERFTSGKPDTKPTAESSI